MTTTLVPASVIPTDWTEDEKVWVEAAGLVFTYPDYHERRGDRVVAPPAVVARFMHTRERTGLDPLARQLYCIPRLGKGGIEWTIQTAIDGFRVIAERSRVYGGQTPVEWLTHDGKWVDVWVKALHGTKEDPYPLAAKVGIIRKDWDEPLFAVATWEEYVQTTSAGKVTSMWTQRGAGQLAKCAEALGLRKAFPQDLSGIYTDDEMATAVPLDLEEQKPEGAPTSRVAQLRAKKEAVDAAQTDSEAVEVEGPSPDAEAAPAGGGDQPAQVSGEATAQAIADAFEVTGPLCAECGKRPVNEEGDICASCEDDILRQDQEAAGR